MTVTARKYNPGFLSDDELVASFCVRTDEFESMVETVRECTGNSNTHQIVIGPRGSGKTSLLLRVAAEIRRDGALSARFFPIVFAEESYEVSTAGEFWLECLSRLADQAPREGDGPDLRRSYEELRQIRDDRTLGDRCLGALQDFADREGRRLVLIVENLNMLFRDIADADTGWRLRETLQTEPRILLLASATSRFDEMDNPKRALYDLFRALALRPLDVEDCTTLWRAVAGHDRAPGTIRALRILTGGSPRLLTIVARFGAELSFRELMADLLDLVDDHTEYFKSHLDALPAQERRVYLALADLWKPATAREIAERARLDTSTCSAQLARLTERGAVEVAGGTPRRKLYYLAERLYNIYYLMRRARGPAPMVEALIWFMEGFFSADELRESAFQTAREASTLDGELLRLHRMAFERLVQLPALEEHRDDLLSLAPAGFGDVTSDLPAEFASLSLAQELLKKVTVRWNEHRWNDALEAVDEFLARFGTIESEPFHHAVAAALVLKGAIFTQTNRKEEGMAVWDEVVRRFGSSNSPGLREQVAASFVKKLETLSELTSPERMLDVSEEIVGRFGSSDAPEFRAAVSQVLLYEGKALTGLNRWERVLATCNHVLEREGEGDSPHSQAMIAGGLLMMANAFFRLKRHAEFWAALGEIIDRFVENDSPTLRRVVVVARRLKALFELMNGRSAEAVELLDPALEGEGAGGPEEQSQAYMIRARAQLVEGDAAACVRDVETALAIFPALGILPKTTLNDLSMIAVTLGPEKMRDLIQASPATELLLPFTTALEMELGLQPRVAKEVEEVAQDIRRDLAERREAKAG